MTLTDMRPDTRSRSLESLIAETVANLGPGQTGPSAYETAWAARLSSQYEQFHGSIEWLRRHQHADGSWGAPLVHNHDRVISTLAGMIALAEVGRESGDRARIKKAEQVLWHYVGRLHQDHNDTVAFPLLAATLGKTAAGMGFDVPPMPTRYAQAFNRKVEHLLDKTNRKWRKTTLVFSLEGLDSHFTEQDDLFESNGSICISPAATAVYLMRYHNDAGVQYMESMTYPDGGVQALAPIDLFEIIWSLNQLRAAGAITPDDPDVRAQLDYLYSMWNPEKGVSTATHFPAPDSDDSAAAFTLLHWGGYDVRPDFFAYYEQDDHFACYPNETDPSVSANVRLLVALNQISPDEEPRVIDWRKKIVGFLREHGGDGAFWSDKWHASPYYVNSTAILALARIDSDVAVSRLRWVLRTQNPDGGWGYLGSSTPEETAYCVVALHQWQRQMGGIDQDVIDAGARYLTATLNANAPVTPLWMSKELYAPIQPAQSAVLAALYAYHYS